MSIRQPPPDEQEQANVVDLDGYRERRRDLTAWHAALDWLDDHGLCACWVLPRPCPIARERAR